MTGTDRLAQLERLLALKESGALTDEEFASEKARILNSSREGSEERPEEIEPEPEPERSSRTRMVIIGVLALAAAVGLGLWASMPVREAVADAALKDGANEAATPKAEETPEVAALSPEQALAAAFKAVTGHAEAYTLKTRDGERKAAPLRLLELPFGPVLLTSNELVDGCHGCAGAIGVYYLDRDGASFTVRKQWPDAVKGWGWGAPPQEWSVTEKFTRFPAVYAEGGYSGQGVSCGSASLTELTSEGPVESELIGLSYSNGGAVLEDTGETGFGEPARDLEGKIVNIVKGKSFDVEVKGADSFRESYQFRGGKYVRTGGESRLSC